jgi:RNA polymerase sigma factor (sigma-70 family)
MRARPLLPLTNEQRTAAGLIAGQWRGFLWKCVKSRVPAKIIRKNRPDFEAAIDDAIIRAVQTYEPSRGVPPQCWAQQNLRGRIALVAHHHKRSRIKSAAIERGLVTRHHRRARLTYLAQAAGDDSHDSDAHEKISRLLHSLDDYERTLLREIFWNGKNNAQVAQMMGVSRETIRLHLRSILLRLRSKELR